MRAIGMAQGHGRKAGSEPRSQVARAGRKILDGEPCHPRVRRLTVDRATKAIGFQVVL